MAESSLAAPARLLSRCCANLGIILDQLFTDLNECSLQDLNATKEKKVIEVRKQCRAIYDALDTAIETIDFIAYASSREAEGPPATGGQDMENMPAIFTDTDTSFKIDRMQCESEKEQQNIRTQGLSSGCETRPAMSGPRELLEKSQKSALQFQLRCSDIISLCDKGEIECGAETASMLKKKTSADVLLVGFTTATAFGLGGLAVVAKGRAVSLESSKEWMLYGGIVGAISLGVACTTYSYQTRKQVKECAEVSVNIISDCKQSFRIISECAVDCNEAVTSLKYTTVCVLNGYKKFNELHQESKELREAICVMKENLRRYLHSFHRY